MHYKRNNKESKTYVQGLRSFGNTLPRGVKGILKKNGYNYSEIISKWNKLVGKEISSCSFPKSIKMDKGSDSGTLVLSIKRGSEIDIEYSKKDIIDKINSYFGYKLISEIRLKASNVKTNKANKRKDKMLLSNNLNEQINKIKSKNIRNSLSEFLDAFKND